MIAIAPAADIAAAYNLKGRAPKYYGRCPFHGGDNPAGLTVIDKPDRPVITCHTAGCDWKADILPQLRADGLAWIESDHKVNYQPKPRRPEKPQFKPIGHKDMPTKAEALRIWASCSPVTLLNDVWEHPYSIAKQIPLYDTGARCCQYRGQPTLVIPQYSLPGWEVCGVQLITGNRTDKGGWEKLNRGPRGIGKVGYIEPGAPLVVVEGWADAASLGEHYAAGNPGIIIAFGQVSNVAANLDLYFNGRRKITAIQDAEQ